MDTTDVAPSPQGVSATTDTPVSTRRRGAHLLAVVVALTFAVTAIGLGGAPAGAAPPSAPRVLTSYGYDLPGPTGSHRVVLG